MDCDLRVCKEKLIQANPSRRDLLKNEVATKAFWFY